MEWLTVRNSQWKFQNAADFYLWHNITDSHHSQFTTNNQHTSEIYLRNTRITRARICVDWRAKETRSRNMVKENEKDREIHKTPTDNWNRIDLVLDTTKIHSMHVTLPCYNRAFNPIACRFFRSFLLFRSISFRSQCLRLDSCESKATMRLNRI